MIDGRNIYLDAGRAGRPGHAAGKRTLSTCLHSVHAPCMPCPCPERALCMPYPCPVCACVHLMRALCIPFACFVHALCAPVHTLCVPIACLEHVLCMPCACPKHTQGRGEGGGQLWQAVVRVRSSPRPGAFDRPGSAFHMAWPDDMQSLGGRRRAFPRPPVSLKIGLQIQIQIHPPKPIPPPIRPPSAPCSPTPPNPFSSAFMTVTPGLSSSSSSLSRSRSPSPTRSHSTDGSRSPSPRSPVTHSPTNHPSTHQPSIPQSHSREETRPVIQVFSSSRRSAVDSMGGKVRPKSNPVLQRGTRGLRRPGI